jgi:hypothetical protein
MPIVSSEELPIFVPGDETKNKLSSEAEFVAASQAGQEVVYLRVLIRGFG